MGDLRGDLILGQSEGLSLGDTLRGSKQEAHPNMAAINNLAYLCTETRTRYDA